ncbi:MAG: class I SAM-dependent methyltransferase [Bacteroidetes bacterium]|nr:class I SAM-dependent methyltransferase [Bacteroidota bacterium]
MKNRRWLSVMGHSKIMAIIGIIASVLILVLMPQLKWIAGLTLGVVLIHIAILLVLSLSVAVVLPEKIKLKLKRAFHKNENDQKIDAGWSLGWLNGFWVVSVVFLAAAVHLYVSFPGLQLPAFFLFLLSINFFIGNLIVRSSKNNSYLTLPWVKLFTDDKARVLDAGCGAGRTTIALSKVFSGKITAFDLFNAEYIDGGGDTLLERNLKLAGIAGQVEIVQGDITKTGFRDATFEAVVSSYMIDHLGDQKLNALNEINRILKPGGRMLMIVLTPTLSSFALLNILSFMLTSKKQWKKLFVKTNFRLAEEGEVNGGTYFLIEK